MTAGERALFLIGLVAVFVICVTGIVATISRAPVRTKCECGHDAEAHEHFHAGKYCGHVDCDCEMLRTPVNPA